VHWGLGLNGVRCLMDKEYELSDNYMIENDHGQFVVPEEGYYSFGGSVKCILSTSLRIQHITVALNESVDIKCQLVCLREGVEMIVSEYNQSVMMDEPRDSKNVVLEIKDNPAFLYQSNDKVYVKVKSSFQWSNPECDLAVFRCYISEKETSWYNTQPDLSLNRPIQLLEGGQCLPGNYFLFLRYMTTDFNRTQFVGQIGPISVYENNKLGDIEGAKQDVPTGKKIRLEIANLDTAYEYYEVGVIRYFGELGYPLNEVYLINNRFPTTQDVITLTGTEDQDTLTIEELFNNNGIEKICEAQTIIDNHYYGASWKSIEVNNAQLAELALKVKLRYAIEEKLVDTDLDKLEGNDPSNGNYRDFYGYNNPENIGKKTGYHRGATVPFAMRFILTDETKTEAFPVTGYDCYSGNYQDENTKGLLRFPFYNEYYSGELAKINDIHYILGVKFDTTDMLQSIQESSELYKNIKGFILVRSEEETNLLYQGVTCAMSSGIQMITPEGTQSMDTQMPIFNSACPLLVVDDQGMTWADAIYCDSTQQEWGNYPIQANKKLLALFSPDLLLSSNFKVYDGRKYYIQVLGRNDLSQRVITKSNADMAPSMYALDELEFPIIPREVMKAEVCLAQKGSNPNFGAYQLFTHALPGDYYKVLHKVPNGSGEVYTLSNRTMSTPTYLALSIEKDIDTDPRDSTYLVNVYSSDPSATDYFKTLCDNFNAINHTYSAIANSTFLTSLSTGYKCFMGNSFQTRMYFRQMHWEALYETSEPQGDTLHQNGDHNYWYAHGLLMGMHVESFCNPGMRHGDNANTYYPKLRLQSVMNDAVSIQGNAYQFIWNDSDFYIYEAFFYNCGYEKTIVDSVLYGYDKFIPNYKREYPTRIRVSAKATPGSYINGYSNFGVNNYVDYDLQGGPIKGLFNVNNMLISVQDRKINQHYTNEKDIEKDNTGILIMGSGQLLSEQVNVLSEYGCQHRFGMRQLGDAVYGIDLLGKRLWSIGITVSTFGRNIPGVNDLTKNNLVEVEVSRILEELGITNSVVDPFGDNPLQKGLSISFDPGFNEVYFNFINGVKKISLVYAENQKQFTGRSTLGQPLSQHTENQLYSVVDGKGYQHDIGVMDFDGQIMPFEISVICNGLSEEQNTSIYNKAFSAHLIECPYIYFEKIIYETPHQKAVRNPFHTLGKEFWKDPEYQSMSWYIPVIDATEADTAYMVGSELKGSWLKMTLYYQGKEELLVKHIRTLFNVQA